MVAYAPLEYGEQVRSYLDALMVHGTFIKGVRRGLPRSDRSTFDMERFIRGIQILRSTDCRSTYSAKALPHLDMAIKIAQSVPNARLIIDHLLKPYIKEHQIEPWHTKMAQLAGFPNVYAKISGLATEADPASWTAADLKPYVDDALSLFGEDRVVFGGDWPPILTANSTYARWVQTALDLTTSMSASGQRKLFGDNARTFYRLPGHVIPAVVALAHVLTIRIAQHPDAWRGSVFHGRLRWTRGQTMSQTDVHRGFSHSRQRSPQGWRQSGRGTARAGIGWGPRFAIENL